MARRGRKRKNVKREPNGRESRAGTADKVFETARNQPHRRSLTNFRDERAVDVLGNLSIAGLIDGEAYEAGKVWRQVVAAHRRAMAIPSPDPKAAGADYVAERLDEQSSEIQLDDRPHEERTASAIDRYQRAFRALHAAGRHALLEVNRVCIRGDAVVDLGALRAGLSTLAWEFGIAQDRRKTMMQSWRAA